MKKRLILSVATPLLFAQLSAHAQSSVTLYGIIDNGINYSSNVGGGSKFAMVNGEVVGSRWGLRGTEDLGSGLHAVFRLESGYNVDSGKLGQGGLLFGRAAYVGFDHPTYGTLTFGRQVNAAFDIWAPFTATYSTIGDFADHPLDSDNADAFYRLNNVAKYVSPLVHGFQFEATYAFSNSTNFADNREYSLAATYAYRSVSGAVAFTRSSNISSSSNPGGAISPTYSSTFLGSAVQTLGAGVRWNFSGPSNIALAYSHVDVYATPDGTIGNIGYGVTLTGQNAWKFDNIELNGQYFFTPALSVAAAYTYTHAGIFATQYGSAIWHQGSLMLNYSLRKRTSVYIMGSYQHANEAAATLLGTNVAALGRSSSENQALARIGMMHRF